MAQTNNPPHTPSSRKDDTLRPFATPDGYFEDLKARVLDKAKSTPQIALPEEPKPSRLDFIKPYLYLAAMFVGLLLMIKGVALLDHRADRTKDTLTSESTTLETHTITEDDVEDFIHYTMEELAFHDELLEH